MLGKARGSKMGNNLLVQEIEKAGGVDFDKPVLLGYTGISDALLLKYIEEQYKTATLEELAEEMNVALSTMSKLVKKSTGSTFKELLKQQRLLSATKLLEHTKLPITDIIEMVGYDNTSYFHRIFKETYQMSPKQYRDWKIRT